MRDYLFKYFFIRYIVYYIKLHTLVNMNVEIYNEVQALLNILHFFIYI